MKIVINSNGYIDVMYGAYYKASPKPSAPSNLQNILRIAGKPTSHTNNT